MQESGPAKPSNDQHLTSVLMSPSDSYVIEEADELIYLAKSPGRALPPSLPPSLPLVIAVSRVRLCWTFLVLGLLLLLLAHQQYRQQLPATAEMNSPEEPITSIALQIRSKLSVKTSGRLSPAQSC